MTIQAPRATNIQKDISMNQDMLEQLAGTTVPPPPADFDRAVHLRLNRTLVIGHLIELVCVVLPFALVEFARAAAAAAVYTLSGRYPAATKNNPK
ncbi:MAG: hypothetical protein ACREHD_08695 [Pirellulales bacterium]